MKLPLIYLTLWWAAAHAAYIRHMVMNRIAQHRPVAFRPGVVMSMRPWSTRGPLQAANSKTPIVVYRNAPNHRFAMKPFSPSGGLYKTVQVQWKPSLSPGIMGSPVAEQQFLRAVSAQPQQVIHSNGAKGAIHTIPAPNLSLSEKPIVVLDSENVNTIASEAPQKTYEVTEKYPDQSIFQMAKIEQPIGFSKASSLTESEFQSLVRNGASLQLPPDFGLSTISLPQHAFVPPQHSISSLLPAPQPFIPQHVSQQQIVQQQSSVPQQQIVSQPQQIDPQQQAMSQPQILSQQHILPQQPLPQQSIFPQAFSLQGFNHQDFIHTNPEGIFISPNALYQPDPSFMQKLTNHILQRFPGVEFIPYNAEVQHHMQAQASVNHPQFIQKQPEAQTPNYVLENEQVTKQAPSSFVTSETNSQKKIIQRNTAESNLVTLQPQEVTVSNVTENQIEVSSPAQVQNITIEIVPSDSQTSTTTVKFVETSTEEKKTTPIYFAQIGQSVGNAETNGILTSINDVRSASALAQAVNPQDNLQTNKTLENVTVETTTTTINPELKAYFVQKPEINEKNETITELKPLHGVPFAKTNDNLNVAYTLHRTDDKEAKVSKDGNVYAGQIVEASITEDHDFNKEKENLLSRRAPIRLFTVGEKKETTTSTVAPQKITVVKAKIPPRSRLTFDEKGEPVLRIYASYIDSPMQKELLTAKLQSSAKHVREVSRKQDTTENSKSATVNAADKTQGHDGNQVTQFGLKLRSRSDADYVPLFEDYEES